MPIYYRNAVPKLGGMENCNLTIIFTIINYGRKNIKGAEYMIHYIRNLRIRFKLYILIGVALIGMLVISGMSFSLMGRMNDMTSDISTSWLPSINTARDLTATISNIRLNELGYLTAISEDVQASSLQYLQKEKEEMETLLATYGELIDEEEKSFYDNAMNFWTQYKQTDEEMMALAKQGRLDEARAILEGECVDLYNSLNNAFNDKIGRASCRERV